MILLTSTSDLVRIVTGSTLNIQVHASYVDLSSGSVTPGRTNTIITTATTTPVVGSPGASTQRNVKTLSVTNTDATLSESVTIQHTDGTNVVELYGITLKAGYTIVYTDANGWQLFDANGALVNAPQVGRFLKSTLLTAASGTFTTSSETNTIRIRGVGGGGGGAGCTSVASAASGGGGGGAGGYLEKVVAVTPNTGYSYTCGALGAGASGALGGNGGNSTFVVGATTYTANGGGGAPVATAVAALTVYKGGNGGAVSTNGDVNGAGAPGESGIVVVVATPVGVGGAGGSGPFGGGGNPIAAVGNGSAAAGFGAGGGGALTGASAVRTGGNGTAGCWVVDEFS